MDRGAVRGMAAGALLVSSMLLGMGIRGEQDLLSPARDYHAIFIDSGGTRVDCQKVNAGGALFLNGEMGRGNLRVSFDNIRRVEFRGDARDYREAAIQPVEGESITLKVRNSLTFYGQTDAGLYQIRARDLHAIEFVR